MISDCVSRRSIIDKTSGKKYFIEVLVESIEDNGKTNKLFKITCTDGRSVWQSNKSTTLALNMCDISSTLLVYLKDLIELKPEGIDESIQLSAISLTFFGKIAGESELKEEDLLVEFVESKSENLNINWKLKSDFGITIVLGAVSLSKLSDESGTTKILDFLDESAEISDLRLKLKEADEVNRKILEEYEKVVKEKLEGEEELFTKFRILLNKTRNQ